MKRIGLTQRVEAIKERDEIRDCLDQRWSDLLSKMGYLCLPLPTINLDTEMILKELSLNGLVLTGGNSLSTTNSKADDLSIERDSFEFSLLKSAIQHDIPILGVCRGMQLINSFFDGSLVKVKEHIACSHSIHFQGGWQTSGIQRQNVNSFHTWTIPKHGLGKDLGVIALDNEGNIEAFSHLNRAVYGIMWHPERSSPYLEEDKRLIEMIFK